MPDHRRFTDGHTGEAESAYQQRASQTSKCVSSEKLYWRSGSSKKCITRGSIEVLYLIRVR